MRRAEALNLLAVGFVLGIGAATVAGIVIETLYFEPYPAEIGDVEIKSVSLHWEEPDPEPGDIQVEVRGESIIVKEWKVAGEQMVFCVDDNNEVVMDDQGAAMLCALSKTGWDITKFTDFSKARSYVEQQARIQADNDEKQEKQRRVNSIVENAYRNLPMQDK